MRRRIAIAVVPLVLLLGPYCRPAGAAIACSWGRLVPVNVCIGR